MTRILKWAFLALLLSNVGAATVETDPVLSIWAQSPEKTWIGTGFLIDENGRFLTCYHVVRGAKELTVYQNKNGYKSIELVAIAPEYDLAVLQINNYPKPGSFMRLSEDPPSRYFDQQLSVRGNPNGLSGNQLDAKLTKPDYVVSGEFRTIDGRGDPIFRSSTVNLIALAMVVCYNGLSGGPVISKGGVVGVLSGSFAQSGTIAWAIPAKYASVSSMTQVHRLVSQMTAWPELSLMRSNDSAWNSLRFDVSVNAGLQLALDSYVSGIDDYDAVARGFSVGYFDESAALLSQTIQQLERVIADEKAAPDANAKIQALKAQITALNRGLPARVQRFQESQAELVTRFDNLRAEVETFQGLLTDSPQNRARNATTNQNLLAVYLNLLQGAKEIVATQDNFVKKIVKSVEGLNKERSLGVIRQKLLSELQLLEEASRTNTRELGSLVISYRRVGDVAESLLNPKDSDVR